MKRTVAAGRFKSLRKGFSIEMSLSNRDRVLQVILVAIPAIYPLWMGISSAASGQTQRATLAFIAVFGFLLWLWFIVGWASKKVPLLASGLEITKSGIGRLPHKDLSIGSMQNMILVNWIGEGPTVYVNKSARMEMIRLHICNRVPENLKILHIDFTVVISSQHMQEGQRLFNQTIAANDCGDLVFSLPLDPDTIEKIQQLDPCIISLQGIAAVVAGGRDFSKIFNVQTTARVFMDPRVMQS